MDIYNQIKNGNISIEKIEEDQEQFNSKLNEITTANSKRKLKDQLDTIKRNKIINLYNDYAKIISEAGNKNKTGERT